MCLTSRLLAAALMTALTLSTAAAPTPAQAMVGLANAVPGTAMPANSDRNPAGDIRFGRAGDALTAGAAEAIPVRSRRSRHRRSRRTHREAAALVIPSLQS